MPQEEKKDISHDDISDVVSKMIDDDYESSFQVGISEQNNLSNNLRHGVMSKLNRIVLNKNSKFSENALSHHTK
jgi:hypothetical protein